MARPREFEPEQALDKVMETFWLWGYHATSVSDLEAVTGLNRPSLYSAFGDKHQLFLAALERYVQRVLEKVRGILEQPGSAKQAIREMMYFYANHSSCAAGRRGCLLVATTQEMLPHDAAVTEVVTRAYGQLFDLLHQALLRAQVNSELNPESDCWALARFLVTVLQGLKVLGKTSSTDQEARQTVDLALSVLG